jgi:hypothetical protein
MRYDCHLKGQSPKIYVPYHDYSKPGPALRLLKSPGNTKLQGLPSTPREIQKKKKINSIPLKKRLSCHHRDAKIDLADAKYFHLSSYARGFGILLSMTGNTSIASSGQLSSQRRQDSQSLRYATNGFPVSSLILSTS